MSGLVVWEENLVDLWFGMGIEWFGCLGGESGGLVVQEENRED